MILKIESKLSFGRGRTTAAILKLFDTYATVESNLEKINLFYIVISLFREEELCCFDITCTQEAHFVSMPFNRIDVYVLFHY